MSAKLNVVRSTFSQFDDSLWLAFDADGTSVRVDIDQSELLGFALNLMDVADDCLRKLKTDTDEIRDVISQAAQLINQAGDKL